MGTEAADSIGQGSAGIGSSTSTSTDVAADMVSEHRTAGTLDTTALAADVRAHAPDDPQVQADLAAAVEAQLTPVEQGQFSAAMQAANDNAPFGVSIEGQEFAVGDFPMRPPPPPGAASLRAWATRRHGTPLRRGSAPPIPPPSPPRSKRS